jgi:hypothetical protein
LVDGLRRSVVEASAPPRANDASGAPGAPAERVVGAEADARFDAARERLRSTVAPPDDDDEQAGRR